MQLRYAARDNGVQNESCEPPPDNLCWNSAASVCVEELRTDATSDRHRVHKGTAEAGAGAGEGGDQGRPDVIGRGWWTSPVVQAM